MLYYGTAQNIQDQCLVLNFTSLIQGYRRWELLPPNNAICISSEYEFDIAYMHYILDNDITFIEFFQMIRMLYIGIDIYLIISEDNWCEMILESLLKLIQQRYGYNATKVNCLEDVIYTDCSQFNTEYGVANYDMDSERFDILTARLEGYTI